MKVLKFFKCRICGNVSIKLVNSGVPMFCCGEAMQELTANTTDGAVEKHCPVVEEAEGKVVVKVGSVAHPMTEEHYISFIVLKTKNTVQIKELNPNGLPQATFAIDSADEVESAYAYCNLHGLWSK